MSAGRRAVARAWRLLLAGGLLVAGGCDRGAAARAEAPLLIFAAASLADVLVEIGAAFAGETGAPYPDFNFAGSQTLAQQILAAPRADLFLSADPAWMEVVEAAGAVAPGTREGLLSNRLVVIAHPTTDWVMDEAADLARLPFALLAMGDPAAVPAGRYARAWLEGVEGAQTTLWAQVAERVIPAPDVRAALALVAARSDLAGIVYATDYARLAGRVRLLYRVPPEDAGPIEYTVARLAKSPRPAQAAAFQAFLRGPSAREIFLRHGFERIPPSSA